jgi:HAMP domain-containing protein
MIIGGVLVVAALLYIGRSISSPLLHLAGCMHRLAANDTDIDIRGTERRDEIGEMARAAVVFRNNAIELMVSQRGLAQQASMLEEKLTAERHLTQLAAQFRIHGVPRVPHAADHHRRPRPAPDQARRPQRRADRERDRMERRARSARPCCA